jgi:hypothetical protein
MHKPTTHFEQVPLAIVRKIVEAQIRLTETTGFAEFLKGGVCQEKPPQKAS